MSLPGNGIFVVQGEMSMLVTAMRRSTRWGSHSFPTEEYEVLMKTFQDLKNILNQVDDLRMLDPTTYLSPFLEVIRSKETTGPVTSLALSAINKFLSYGLIDPMHSSVPSTVEDIADAVTHARFVGTDHSSDGVVLMKIVQVLRTLMLSPEGAMLTDQSVCEIMLSCFRICFETRLTELLRRYAEQCLRDMTQLVFMRLPQFGGEALSTAPYQLSLTRRDRPDRRKATHGTNSLERQKSGKHGEKILEVQGNMTSTESNYKIKEQNIPESEITIEPDPTNDPVRSNKKHGRHSSMDLATSNTSISQLLQKCVNHSDDDSGNVVEPAQENDQSTQSETTELNEAAKVDTDESNEVKPSEELVQPAEVSSELDTLLDGNTCVKESEKEEELEVKDSEKLEGYVSQRGIRFTPQDDLIVNKPYGMSCVWELFRFLISLCNPLDNANTSLMVQLGLSLVQTALEVAAEQLPRAPALLRLVQDPLCRNLLSLLNTERITIFALDLQVSFLIFESLRPHLKFQMEAYLKKLIDIISTDTSKSAYELKEISHLALENLAQMFKIPGLCTEIYLNYDCDIYCSDLFEDITDLLSKNVVASTNFASGSLYLEVIMTIIEAIEAASQVKDGKEMEIVETVTEDDAKGRGGHVTLELGGMDDASVLSDHVTHDISHYFASGRVGRHRLSSETPSDAELDDIKNRKKLIVQGTELFNLKPERGIAYLQQHGILSTPLDAGEVAAFLRENHALDKKMIGEYICKRHGEEAGTSVLAAFADSFEFGGLRIDAALRHYLETFRLPGEAPLIFLVMEHFADRWHKCNGSPFANTDAAFRLAYALIMLNMDQHNHNARKLNVPMDAEAFVRNLRGCNGSGDYDARMLRDVFNSIRDEEMVMPAEHTGPVRDAYLWRVLQRRGGSPAARYRPAAPRMHRRLFQVACPSVVTALSSAFEKAPAPSAEELEAQSHASCPAKLALWGLERCAALLARQPAQLEPAGQQAPASQSQLSFDTLVLTLATFTGLLNPPETSTYIAIGVSLGGSTKAQLALRRVCAVAARHADCMRHSWRLLVDIVRTLYLGRLLPQSMCETEDYVCGAVSLVREARGRGAEGLLSSLYSYIALGEAAPRAPTPHERALCEAGAAAVAAANLHALLVAETKFLQLDSLMELVRCMITAGAPPEPDSLQLQPHLEDCVIFFLELLSRTTLQNRDRVLHIWGEVSAHIRAVLQWSVAQYSRDPYALERALTVLLRTSAQLMRSEHCASAVLADLTVLYSLPYKIFYRQADRISCGLYELVKTSAQNVHSAEDWATLFALLAACGAGAWPASGATQRSPAVSSRSEGSEEESEGGVGPRACVSSDSELSTSPPSAPPGWILVKKEEESESAGVGAWPGGGVAGAVGAAAETHAQAQVVMRAHRLCALRRCCEALALLVRDVAHITPYNLRAAVRTVRMFAAAALASPHNKKKEGSRKTSRRRSRSNEESSEEDDGTLDQYHTVSMQLLDLMHTLHSRTAQIFRWWREEADSAQGGNEEMDLWEVAWMPLLQGIAQYCVDSRKQVSNSGVAYLQRALLAPGLRALGAAGWERCFQRVLFPLLAALPRHRDVTARANTIMCKVFLHHLGALSVRPTFGALWTRVLGVQRALVQPAHGQPAHDDPLREAALESLKNMILVMDSVKVFSSGEGGYNELWQLTWERIAEFLPDLKDELFPHLADKDPKPHPGLSTSPQLPPSLPQLVPAIHPPAASLPATLSPATSLPATSLPVPLPVGASLSAPVPLPALVTSQATMTSQSPPPRNALYKPTLTSSVLLQPLNQLASTPIAVQMHQPYPILYPSPDNKPASQTDIPMNRPANQTFTLSASQESTTEPKAPSSRVQESTDDKTVNLSAVSDKTYADLYNEYLTNPYTEFSDISAKEAALYEPNVAVVKQQRIEPDVQPNVVRPDLTADTSNLPADTHNLTTGMQNLKADTHNLTTGMQNLKADTHNLTTGMQNLPADTHNLTTGMQNLKAATQNLIAATHSLTTVVDSKVDVVIHPVVTDVKSTNDDKMANDNEAQVTESLDRVTRLQEPGLYESDLESGLRNQQMEHLVQKSYSEHSSPLKSLDRNISNSKSSDHLPSESASHSIFNFTSYFNVGTERIPPGSEILFEGAYPGEG